MVKYTSRFLFHHLTWVKSGTTKMQVQKVSNILLLVLTGIFQAKSTNKKVDMLNECLKNIFHNFVPNKMIKCGYRQPPWMTDSTKNKQKERAQLTKNDLHVAKKNPT